MTGTEALRHFDLSVLLTPTKSGGNLTASLDSLSRHFDGRISAEIVVVVPRLRRDIPFERCISDLRDRGLYVTVLEVAVQAPNAVPKWRAMAFRQASGRVCVFLEDNALVEPGWWEAWDRLADRDDWTVATGVVLPDRDRLNYSALGVFFCEYGLFVPASDQGRAVPLKRVAGNHWAVHHEKVIPNEPVLEIDEHTWTHRYVPDGQKPKWNFEASVTCFRTVGPREAIGERARQGFRFGRDEARSSRAFRKLKMIHGGPAIVLVQLARLTFVVAMRRNQRGSLVRSLPWTILLLKAWSFSEWAGWCCGSAEALFHANLKNRADHSGQAAKDKRSIECRVVKAHHD